MIKSFADRETKKFFQTGKSRKVPDTIHKAALRKLDYLNAAASLDDLRVPPGNMLEALTGDLKGKYSIRINQQYRIVFAFEKGDAYDVSIMDYH
ncbi:type II toxin-antitoxin system RelE/ParE family toxin [Hydrogenimonas cancrithermarum]|uniref:Plasmid maintenance system killer protein n=1 Tax=Hydrogenimonas cancrithermarum TaxID=2993563 RepID=A0ABM8FI00_9BACT|nr:type II toxin-antitoxin system RelE/ParE family toxin [Hydrogenimonas cancrithermarum]BDY11904.1 plasmid maintenance system killer protein [Hydrogenimonas cancrithermarum]